MTRTLLELIGAVVCRWNGKHKWVRRELDSDGNVWSRDETLRHGPGKLCTRCGITKPVRARKAKSQDGVQTGVYDTVVTRDGAVVK